MSYIGTKYPDQVASIKHSSASGYKTLAIRGILTLATAENGYNPLEVYQDGGKERSRFEITVIETGTGTPAKIASYNIPIADLAGIFKQSDLAQQLDFFQKYMPAKVEKVNASPTSESNGSFEAAYTTKIKNGKLAGKTPSEVLKEDPSGQSLKQQREWLEKNLDKYPGNRQQIDAIDAAFAALKAGALSGSSSSSSSLVPEAKTKIPLYESMKGSPYKGDNDIHECKECRINWVLGNNNPVEVEIVSYKAPLRTNAEGKINIDRSRKTDELKCQMFLNSAEWNDCIRRIKTTMRQFEALHCRDVFQDSRDAFLRNLEASKT